MMRYRTAFLLLSALGFAGSGAVAQVSVTIDANTRYQTIEGFGAHGAKDVWWSNGPFYDAAYGAMVIDNLGFTMIRNEFYPTYEPVNDNGDPNTFGTFNMNGEWGTKQVGYVNSMKAKAAASGETLRWIATYWSPPAWMKVNNSTVGTGTAGDSAVNKLKAGVEAELGEYGVATVKAYKDNCGVDLYALSMQNESAFDETYNSCVYSPTHYRDVFKIFGARVHATYPNVKLFGAEHMLGNWGYFEGALSADTAARRHVGAFAVHGYSDGVRPQPGSNAAALWRRASGNATSANKPLWMTETSGYDDVWTNMASGPLPLAEMIYAALKFGKLSAWVWWQMSSSGAANVYELMNNGVVTKRAWVHKQFSRYIRPDAVMVKAAPSDTNLFAVAFHHTANRTLSIVFINSTGSSKAVTLLGNPIPTFTAYRTSASEDCANVGTVTGGTVTVPATSIVTLYGTNYDPAVSIEHAGVANFRLASGHCNASVYALDGRLVTTMQSVKAESNGRIAWDGRDVGGNRVASGSYYAMLIDENGALVKAGRIPIEVR
jgi:O-glycosyl hydrolase